MMTAKPVKLTEIAQAVADAKTIVTVGLGYGERPEVEAAVYGIVLRELLGNDTVRDLPLDWKPAP
jgi:hypothetical protein